MVRSWSRMRRASPTLKPSDRPSTKRRTASCSLPRTMLSPRTGLQAMLSRSGGDCRVDRRLAAILVTDVVGYSRLIAIDEAGTLAALTTRPVERLPPLLERHKGRLVKLWETVSFWNLKAPSVRFNAQSICKHPWPKPTRPCPRTGKSIVFRIGVNLGEV